jgi:hypothetical protein
MKKCLYLVTVIALMTMGCGPDKSTRELPMTGEELPSLSAPNGKGAPSFNK